MFNAEQRGELRRVLRMLEPHVKDLVQDRVQANHEAARPGTSLDQIMFNTGQADGMAELWAELTAWSEEPQ